MILIAFSEPISNSTLYLIDVLEQISAGGAPMAASAFGEAEMRGLALSEVIALLLVAILLVLRGWTLADLGSRPTIRQTGAGLALLFGVYGAYAMIWNVLAAAIPKLTAISDAFGMGSLSASTPTVLAFSALNAAYEEVLLCGYLMTVLQRHCTGIVAVIASTLLRLSYHLYQGPAGILSILIIGVTFSVYYRRTRELWPLVLAHFALDVNGLLSLPRG